MDIKKSNKEFKLFYLSFLEAEDDDVLYTTQIISPVVLAMKVSFHLHIFSSQGISE